MKYIIHEEHIAEDPYVHVYRNSNNTYNSPFIASPNPITPSGNLKVTYQTKSNNFSENPTRLLSQVQSRAIFSVVLTLITHKTQYNNIREGTDDQV